MHPSAARALVLALTLSAIPAPLAHAGQPTEARQTAERQASPRIAMLQPRAAFDPPATVPGSGIVPSTATRQRLMPDPATLCETAVTSAEFAARLPPRLLGAISLTETGRLDPAAGRLRPWPWTINAEGEGQFFATEQAAIEAVTALRERGVQSIDVGCMQINLMYHPDAFASLQAAFDPRGNAAYAARFLNALYAESRDWSAAVAAYHSETPVLGDAYRVLVMARWQNGDPHAAVIPHSTYGDFARSDSAYGDQANGQSYGAFAPRSQVYRDFAPR